MKQATIPQWNLSDLYNSIKDPKIEFDKREIDSKIKLLSKNFKEDNLSKSLKLYEEIRSKQSILSGYAHLVYSTNTNNNEISHFYQNINEFETNCETQLIWFELFLIKSDKVVKKYENYLEKLRVFKPYTLDEDKEIILTKKNQTGSTAFIRFFDQIDSNKIINNKTFSEMSSIFSNDKNRNTRKKAGELISKNLQENSSLYRFILNTLLLDKKVDDEIRGYKYPQQATFLSYDVDEKIVGAMTKVITKNYSVSERYYIAKSKLLGLKLYEWDRYNDIYPEVKGKVTWEESKNIVLNSFKNFSQTFYEIANKFFQNNWIDAKVAIGKRSGAYCSYVTNSIHPYVFMNFTGDSTDVRTLAHELGHAIHGTLSKENNYFDFRPSTTTAEIASIFSESLIFDELFKKTKLKKEKINLLGSKLQNSFATVFRQNAFYIFETEIHKRRRDKGELSTEEINDLYQKHLQPMFGKGLTLSENHKFMWMIISHFYHYNFYVFTYSFGELLATSLYAIYKKDGTKFVEKYIKALRLGGSKSPIEITKSMGIDITKEDFWQNGLDLISNQVKEFEKLTTNN